MPTERPPRLPDDVTSREGRLRRTPFDQRTELRDGELAGILDRVGERRIRRSGDLGIGSLNPSAAVRARVGTVAPEHDDGVSTEGEATEGSADEAPGVDGPAIAAGPTGLGIGPTAARPNVAGPAGATPDLRGAPGKVLSIDQVGPTVRIIRVGRPAGFSYTAGQHFKIGTAGTRRGTYSIASAPHDTHVEIAVKLVPDGRLTPALFSVRPGDSLVSDWKAKGSFRFDDRARTHVMVATGAGISPLRSLLRDARRRGLNGPVIVLHGASHPDELPYHDEMLALTRSDPNLRYVPTISRPSAPRSRGWRGTTGRVDALVRATLGGLDTGNTRVYVCGNGGMVKAVANDAAGRGFPVSTESFG